MTDLQDSAERYGLSCTHPHWTREGNCEDCGARWDDPLERVKPSPPQDVQALPSPQ